MEGINNLNSLIVESNSSDYLLINLNEEKIEELTFQKRQLSTVIGNYDTNKQ